MTNEYELAGPSRAGLIYEKQDLLGPLLPGMLAAPHPMVPGTTEKDYYRARSPRRSPSSRRGWTPGACRTTRTASGRRHGRRGARRRPAARDRGAPRDSTLSRGARRTLRAAARAAARRSCSGCSAPVMVLGRARPAVFAQKAVHAALCMALVMVGLGVVYFAQQAPFLGSRADLRLHRRRHDALPLRAHARRRRLLRLPRRDDQGPAGRAPPCSASAWPSCCSA